MAQTGRVIRAGEVYLGSYHYRLAEGTGVQQKVISAFPPKQITGEYSYANQEILSSYVIKDQRGGIGIEEMDESKDALRCWFSDLQLGYRGHLPLPKLATLITTPNPTFVAPTGFVDTGAGWNTEANAYDDAVGTNATSNAITLDSWSEFLELTIAATTIDGIEFYVGTATGAAITQIDVDLYYNSAWNNLYSGTFTEGVWEFKAVTGSPSVTSARVRFQDVGGGGQTAALGEFKFLKQTGGTFTYIPVNFNGVKYVAIGPALYKLNSTRDTFTPVYASSDGNTNNPPIKALIAGPNSMLYIYWGDSAYYKYMTTGEAVTNTNVTDATLGIEWDAKLFKLDADGNFWYTATPNSATPTWTSTGGITNIKSGDISRLFIGPDSAGADIIYASTTSVLKAYSFSDGLWTDSYVKLPEHPTGGDGALTWRNGIYVSYGLDTLKYVPINATVDAVGLSRDDGLPVEYNGEVVYFTDGDAYLIALVDASKTSGNSKSGVYAWDGQGWQHLWSPPTTLIEDCEDAWNELVDADVTASLDTTDFQVGAGSAKFVIAAGLAAGDIIATELITSKDLSQHNSVSLRVKSSVACDASDLQLLLDNTAQCASPLETLNLPALVADTWTKVVLTLAAASSDTAIVSVGIKMAVDKGAFNLWIDQIEGQTYNGVMNSAIVSSASSGYALYYDHDSKVYYIDLQRGTRNVNKLPAVATYASSGIHISPWFDAGSAKDSKTVKRLVLYCRGMSSTETIIVKYRINHTYTDLDTGWTTLGTITSNGKTTYNVGSGAGFAFDDIQLRFDLARGSTNTNTPDFTAVLEYLKRKTLWAWSFVIDASGGYDLQSPRQQETSLNTAVEAALLQEFTFRGETDESKTKWVFIQPFSYDTQTGEQHHSIFEITVVEP